MPDDMAVFEEWMKNRDISYETEALKLKRFETFKASLREAEEAFPLTKEPMWVHLNKFSDLTDEEFRADYLSWEPESDDEDEKKGVHAWYIDESISEKLVVGMTFEDWFVEEEGSTVGVKRKGLCFCDEKDTTNDQVDATVKRQRPCSCFTAPPAAAAADDDDDDDDEHQDAAAPV